MSGRLAVISLMVSASVTGPAAAAPPPAGEPPSDRVASGEVLDSLEMWDLARAQHQVEALADTEGNRALVDELRGRVMFFEGDYAGAAAVLKESGSGYAALVQATEAEIKADQVRHSDHFEIHYGGKDEVLVPYALETLEAARQRIGEDLGFLPTEPIRVEILEDPSALSRLSPLTQTEIETSGTIALCKYNKLMVVSPRALLTGYTWQDTLAHELTHYLITRKSHNKTPIWLHEGIAKFEESRWRSEAGEALSPATAALLQRRLQQNTLITFEQMHPSIALLPSQEDAALAFAEVSTTIEYLVKERKGSLPQLLQGLAEGLSDTHAVERAAGEPFDQLTRGWKAYLRRRPMPREVLPLSPETLKFKAASTEKRPSDDPEAGELSEIEDPAARRLAHLGALLFARGRPVGALAELGKAEARVGARSPMLSNLYARALLDAGRVPEAQRVLRASLIPYPDIAQTHRRLGQSELGTGVWEAAKQDLLDANAVDPFDPEIHAGLLRVAKQQNDAAAVERETQALAILAKN